MTTKARTIRLTALVLVLLLALSACATGDPPPATSSGDTQPAATATTPTEEPVAATEPIEEAPAAGGEQTFVIQPEQSEASYTVDEEFLAGAVSRLGIEAGQTRTVGATNAVNGQLVMDFSGPVPQLVSGEFTVDISTLRSDQRMRDDRIRSRALESSRFPTASFTATEILSAPDSYSEGEEVSFEVAGDLTIREITMPGVFQVTATMANGSISGVATTQINMTDFGFEPPSIGGILTVGNVTDIAVTFVAQS